MRTKSIATRSTRRARRHKRNPSTPSPKPAAIQVFLFRLETYVGCELFELSGPITVGRHPRAQLRIDGDTISRHHCRLVSEEGELFVEDLGSANGTFVNRMRVKGRMAIEATDAIHVGSYTLKLRVLGAEPRANLDPRQAEIETRVEAVLSIDITGGAREKAIDLQAGVDRRLYEAAIKRQTGAEAARSVKSEPEPIPQRPNVAPDTTEDSTLMAAAEVSLIPEPEVVRTPSERVALDPSVEARLKDLDELIAALDAKQTRRPSMVPWRDPEQERSQRMIAGEAPEEEDDEDLNETCEFARDLASSLALDGAMVAGEAQVISLDSRRKSTTKDRASLLEDETTLEGERRGAEAIEESIPISEIVERVERPRRKPHEARLVTPTEMQASVRPLPTPRPTVDTDESMDSSLLDDVWASRIEDHVEELVELRKQALQAPPPPQFEEPEVEVHEDEAETIAATGEIEVPQELRQPPPNPEPPQRPMSGLSQAYDGVEIASRVGGRLADIAVLRKSGDQFILGHATPQGSVAPAKAHVGLRLLRVNDDRTVDLVFPKEVAGHLVRGQATVMFSELTEGRKYSCLRLEINDVATVILGDGRQAISYHIRFLTRPKSLFRSLKGVGS